MKSANTPYIPEIDHLRLLAAVLVFAYHFFHIYYGNWQPFPQWALLGLVTEGQTGVSLFFVLSGFIFMTIALGSAEIDYRGFLRNRLLRIAPLFLVVFVVAISIGRDRFVATDLLYLFVTNLGDAPTSWHIITGPAWSISVEFMFYLVFPFLAACTKQRGPSYLFGWIALLAIVKVGAYLATDNARHMLYSTLVGRFDQFLIGMLGAMALSRFRTTLERHGRMLLAVTTLCIILAVAGQARWASYGAPDQRQPFWIIWGTIEATLWTGFILAYLAARLPLAAWLNKTLAAGGNISFSFYMWHALVIYTAHSLFGLIGGQTPLALAMNGLAVLMVSLVVAQLSYNSIERPFLELRKRYAGS